MVHVFNPFARLFLWCVFSDNIFVLNQFNQDQTDKIRLTRCHSLAFYKSQDMSHMKLDSILTIAHILQNAKQADKTVQSKC